MLSEWTINLFCGGGLAFLGVLLVCLYARELSGEGTGPR